MRCKIIKFCRCPLRSIPRASLTPLSSLLSPLRPQARAILSKTVWLSPLSTNEQILLGREGRWGGMEEGKASKQVRVTLRGTSFSSFISLLVVASQAGQWKNNRVQMLIWIMLPMSWWSVKRGVVSRHINCGIDKSFVNSNTLKWAVDGQSSVDAGWTMSRKRPRRL